MAAIRRLPQAIANRIAAGEVIERPAAAAKELIENALDAGAQRISVAIEAGGIGALEVVDDGAGMTAADLALAIERHATSKLADDDLVHITTLGFRGEALPSIGAAARLAITSRTADAAHATTIRVEGGRIFPLVPAAGPPGTRVLVRDFFFATPARRKFLKRPQTEAEHVEAVVRRLALVAPGVAFRLAAEGRVVLERPAEDLKERLAALLGPEAAAQLVPVTAERGPFQLVGFAARPAYTRASAAHQFLAVNHRPVADPVLRVGVRVAYRSLIPPGRHPVVALFLSIPAEDLDVNVHPAKTELRFRDPGVIRALVIGGLNRALAAPAQSADAPPAAPALHLAPAPITRVPMGFAEEVLPLAAPPSVRPIVPSPEPSPAHPLGAAVAQVLDTYIIAVTADENVVLVDQHAAHERLTRERLAAERAKGAIRAQRLLMPAIVDLAPADVARLAAHGAELAELGLVLESFGPTSVLVRALPAALGEPDPAPLVRDLADELSELGEGIALTTRLDQVLASLACHHSVRAGRRLAQAEMDALLRSMEATPLSGTCPHGRPTFVKLAKADLERLFARR